MEMPRTALFEQIEPDTCTRHYQFDFYIRKNILPLSHYDLLLKDNHAILTGGNLIMAKEPHFKMKSRFSKKTFYIETKYVPQSFSNAVKWCEPDELLKYQEVDNYIPVYIILGEGIQPDSPDRLYLFSMKNVWCNKVSYSNLDRFSIPVSGFVDEARLWSLRLHS